MHQVSGGYEGTVTDARIRLEEMRRAHDTLMDILAKHTGQPLDKLRADSDRDYWLSAAEARDYGIVDRVMEKGER
jgi:ATP-dependent Clp protease, protease subunit